VVDVFSIVPYFGRGEKGCSVTGNQGSKGALDRTVGHPSHLPIFRNARSRAATRSSLT
jgi:hypothetical protein